VHDWGWGLKFFKLHGVIYDFSLFGGVKNRQIIISGQKYLCWFYLSAVNNKVKVRID
jgi:hypothetical protein